ncbi:amidohydrolase/deacetylase family metallohydrolase [Paenibacillus sp. GCM10023248]|uniref:amidohydrolase/deacetylase family metallohydrolase n=1 Tax=unclassified Paenibacillus TaxID=185978 RepID=UPI002378081F|nr:amidohydrolase/deacetylase family metallohydrolase [Paenibacillus sp. MAHUQ-63]MDD9265708.1 amidohydrolase/deacetylase family metallohydrolase [Paenibacillus sp. MAHUQ-63]
MQERYVLHNVKHVNGESVDIVIENGKIAELAPPGQGQGKPIRDYAGAYVSSGWIDMHVHAFPAFDPYGDEIDEIGIKQGVTTIVDAGSCGADRIADLAASRRSAATNVLAFLNISRIGLQRIDELSDMSWIDSAEAARAVKTYPDMIVGLKARISQSVVRDSGLEPLRAARELSGLTSLPLMVHIGSGPPSIEEVVSLLEEKDIITHYLNGKANNLFDQSGKPLDVLTKAIARGVHLDVGHGTASFSFRVAEAAKRHGIHFDTISTDIYRGNRLNGPVYSMSNVLAKFLYLGYPLQEVIDAVTKRAAAWLGKPELGRIQVGDTANLTLFAVKDEPVLLKDSEGDTRTGEQLIQPKGVVANGTLITC